MSIVSFNRIIKKKPNQKTILSMITHMFKYDFGIINYGYGTKLEDVLKSIRTNNKTIIKSFRCLAWNIFAQGLISHDFSNFRTSDSHWFI